jgi:lysophospholipase L1-like esterase
MKKVRLLFQGDSITDAGRDKRDFHDLGPGYPKFAAQLISDAHPEISFDFINLGISGNRTGQLFDRLYPDAISLQPDVISILIGINDIWHRSAPLHIATTDEQLELNYREILKSLKSKTNAKIVILAPYVLDADVTSHMKNDLATVLPIIKKLADEYADVYIPLNELFEDAISKQPAPLYYSTDGVHPNENGAKFIGECYAHAVEKLFS